MTFKNIHVTKLQMDGLFDCHVVGWSKITLNMFGTELFPKFYHYALGRERINLKKFTLKCTC